MPKINVQRWTSLYGERAEQWLAELPSVVASYADQWELTVDGALEGGAVSTVIAVEHEDEQAVLKIHPPWSRSSASLGRTSAETEAGAFTIWDGECAPRLLKSDARALLLERIVDAEHPAEMSAKEMVDLVLQTSIPKGDRRVAKFLELGVPSLEEEVWKRYCRANEQRHDAVSDVLLLRAAVMSCYLCIFSGRIGPWSDWELVHGDLKLKNILKRPNGKLAVIDPSPAFGGGLYDVALWAIDDPDLIEQRCLEAADYLNIWPQTLGSLAMTLAIPEICLASPARADATLETIKEITGTTNLEKLFDTGYLDAQFMEPRYTVIKVPDNLNLKPESAD